jgi:hypothetical protein
MMYWKKFNAASSAFAKQLPELRPRDDIITFNYGTGERYLRQKGFFPV